MKNKVAVVMIIAFLTILTFLTVVTVPIDASVVEARHDNATDETVTYSLAASGDYGYLNPFNYQRGPGSQRTSLIFDTLVYGNDTEVFIPLLAADWEYLEEENAYVFYLRDDVFWHDGKKFTSEDVVFTFYYMKEHPEGSWQSVTPIEKTEALDDYTVKIYLNQVYPLFLERIAKTIYIVPKHIWQNITDPIMFRGEGSRTGTGPFTLLEYDKVQGTYSFKANENFYLGKPEVDILEYKNVGAEMAPEVLKRGEVNYATIPAEVLDDFIQEGFVVQEPLIAYREYLTMNYNKEPFNSKEFRHVIAYAINKQEIVDVALGGHGVVALQTWIPPSRGVWYNPDVKEYNINHEKVKELLLELGYEQEEDGYFYKDGEVLEIDFTVQASEQLGRVAEIVKHQLEEAGIKVEMRSFGRTTHDDMLKSGNYELALTGCCGDGSSTDPGDDPFDVLVKGTKTSFNLPYNWSERMVELTKAQQVETNTTKRIEQVHEMQEIYAEEIPRYALYYPTTTYAVHDGTVNIQRGGPQGGGPLGISKLSFMLYTEEPMKIATTTPESGEQIPAEGFFGVMAAILIASIANLLPHKRRREEE
jgi:peptide/nickel transport system substrate-binding protein